MNSFTVSNAEQNSGHLDWLSHSWLAHFVKNIKEKDERYFCNTIKTALVRGWTVQDARNYALGKLLVKSSW